MTANRFAALPTLTAKIAALETAQLLEVTKGISTDYRDGEGVIFAACLDELMIRLPEAEFVAFCDSL